VRPRRTVAPMAEAWGIFYGVSLTTSANVSLAEFECGLHHRWSDTRAAPRYQSLRGNCSSRPPRARYSPYSPRNEPTSPAGFGGPKRPLYTVAARGQPLRSFNDRYRPLSGLSPRSCGSLPFCGIGGSGGDCHPALSRIEWNPAPATTNENAARRRRSRSVRPSCPGESLKAH
jgi:hypothetical protein